MASRLASSPAPSETRPGPGRHGLDATDPTLRSQAVLTGSGANPVVHRHPRSRSTLYARLHQHLMGSADARGDLEWLVSVDSTIVRAHQHAAGARREDQGGLAQDTGGSVELQGIPA
jgi:transposase